MKKSMLVVLALVCVVSYAEAAKGQEVKDALFHLNKAKKILKSTHPGERTHRYTAIVKINEAVKALKKTKYYNK